MFFGFKNRLHSNNGNPRSLLAARSDRIQNSHIGDGIGQRRRNWCVIQDCQGELIGLNLILVARFESDFVGASALLMPYPYGLVGRSVEGNFQLNAPIRSENGHVLE